MVFENKFMNVAGFIYDATDLSDERIPLRLYKLQVYDYGVINLDHPTRQIKRSGSRRGDGY